jgi:hypothetical protein
MRYWSGALLVALSAALFSGSAESALPQTIGDLITACDSSDANVRQDECHQVFKKMYGTTLMSESGLRRPDGYVSCLPKFPDRIEDEAQAQKAMQVAAAEFESKLLAYLRGRPDVRGKQLVQGLVDAIFAVYTCLAPANGGGRN